MDRKFTHDPAWYRYATRLFWESMRFVRPVIPVLLVVVWFKTLLYWWGIQSHSVFFALIVPSYAILSGLCLCLVVLAGKWMLLGRVKVGQHPLWSCWCSRWDSLHVMWAFYAKPVLSAFEGTLFLAWYLRAMGARVGSRVVLGSTFSQVVDPDMLSFDRNATISCMFQAHSFEDRVLKIGHVSIGQRCTVGSGAVLLYGANIGDGTWVGENSVVMKHESLLPGRYYSGCPTRPRQPPATT
jgi:non-ribosomal peptide synthetase-like protein